ncbi:MAG: tetratricopeptide repeat protein [Alkalispirochaetaceae bacterium]
MATKGRKSGLKKGWHLFRRRKYAQLISFLEPQVFMYRENPDYFELLGLSCLYTGDYAGAHSYLRRAEQMDPERIRVLNALAAVALRRRQSDEALRLWLSVLDKEPKNRLARRGLALLRETEDPGELMELFEEGKASRFMPREPWTVPPLFWVVVLLGALGLLGFLATPQLIDRIEAQRSEQRSGSELVTPPPEGERLETEGEFRIVLTEDELLTTLRRAREYFNEYRDNMAQLEINRLLASNASQPIRERARLLENYLREPDFTSFRDNFTYNEIAREPWLYEKSYVRWKGTVSNLELTDERISFDFLVGYQDRQVLEGVVPAYLEFAALLEGGQAVELIGEIERDENEAGFTVRVTSVRMLEPGSRE